MPMHMMIDARNALYRSIYAVKAESIHKGKAAHAADAVTCLMRMFVKWINKYRPTSVHVFWDAPRATVWRRKILPTYKDRTQSDYVENISDDLEIVSKLTNEALSYLNVRQYSKKMMEADDLIYAATTLIHPESSVIVSTDSDMVQIPFFYGNSAVYDPKKDIEVDIPSHNPATLKALVGDKSDTIDGYYGIGPVKGLALVSDRAKLHDFLDANDRKVFLMNQLLIDLSLCPHLLANRMYASKILAAPVAWEKPKFIQMITTHKINGILQELGGILSAFKDLK